MSDDTTRTLVLRQFAALRRHGASAPEALNQLLEGLPPGPVREACTLAARALASPGAVPSAADDLVHVLAQPMGTGEAADHLAAALEARGDAQDALRSATLLFQVAIALPLLGLSLLGWFGPAELMASFGDGLPVPTRLLLTLAEALRWVGGPLALAAVWALQRSARSFAPGFAAFDRAARVLEHSSRAPPTVDIGTLGLPPVELSLLWVLRAQHEPSALRTLADELSREGRASVATFQLLAPVVVGVLGAVLAGAVLTALYLPLFTIAGSIK